ncbi:hypothetical protein HQ308_14725 [Rhodococcus sp. BP-241]|uniref:hypothetical protein n=1 Tax=Rhodococcus sp. BP-241 TaxID=2739441 RepID=UPI001C9A6C99|nr:hypothetical protein [Rhodococcus sp. BP-241]MBY6708057.1 hypothetical protein [Rhodococcus sp. BP-241]
MSLFKRLGRFWWIGVVVGALVVIALPLSLAAGSRGPDRVVPDGLQLLAAIVAPLGAIFTTLGVGVALFVAIRDSRRFAREEQTRRDEDTDRRADQARLITLRTEHWGSEMRTIVSNNSDQPILDLRIGTPRHTEEESEWTAESSPTSDRPSRLEVLKAGSEAPKRWRFLYRDVAPGEGTTFPDSSKWKQSIVFVDSRGVRWMRTGRDDPRLFPLHGSLP